MSSLLFSDEAPAPTNLRVRAAAAPRPARPAPPAKTGLSKRTSKGSHEVGGVGVDVDMIILSVYIQTLPARLNKTPEHFGRKGSACRTEAIT